MRYSAELLDFKLGRWGIVDRQTSKVIAHDLTEFAAKSRVQEMNHGISIA